MLCSARTLRILYVGGTYSHKWQGSPAYQWASLTRINGFHLFVQHLLLPLTSLCKKKNGLCYQREKNYVSKWKIRLRSSGQYQEV